jgi:hypothetical protein
MSGGQLLGWRGRLGITSDWLFSDGPPDMVGSFFVVVALAIRVSKFDGIIKSEELNGHLVSH